jgi:hypothetical protein
VCHTAASAMTASIGVTSHAAPARTLSASSADVPGGYFVRTPRIHDDVVDAKELRVRRRVRMQQAAREELHLEKAGILVARERKRAQSHAGQNRVDDAEESDANDRPRRAILLVGGHGRRGVYPIRAPALCR